MYRALVVDDDPAVLQTLKLLFQIRHFEVRTASSAGDAINELASGEFDVVITDMRMETNTAGFEVVRCAKQQTYSPAVVILSAFPIPIQDWRGSGADANFLKGSGSLSMIDDIERMLEGHTRARTAS